MSDLELRYRKLDGDITRKLGQRDAVLAAIERDRTKLELHEETVRTRSLAIEIVHTAAEARRQELKERVESLVTKALRAVFQREDFEFGFNVRVRGDILGIVPVLRSKFGDRDLETAIVDGHGGGVADVVSFILRVIVLSLARPRVAPIMILDETFKHVSPEYLRGVSVLMKELSVSAGIQFILVTHKSELLDAADVIYRASLGAGGATSFTLEHNLRDESYHRKPQRGETAPDTSTLFDHEDFGKLEDGDEIESGNADVMARRQRRNNVKRKRKK